MDGQQVSDTSVQQITLDRNHWTLRIAVDKDAAHVGGLTLYGKGFGNTDQDIMFGFITRNKHMNKSRIAGGHGTGGL